MVKLENMFSGGVITFFSLIVLLFSIVLHELAHGYTAYSLGDPTAKYAGRLTLNPLKHLDFFGSIILPFFLLLITAGQGPIFGWAKPVPINPYNFRDRKWGTLKVSLAGPLANFSLALFFGLLIRFLNYSIFFPLMQLLSIVVLYNFLWGFFNLLPIPPLDGSWVLFRFLSPKWEKVRFFLEEYGLFILVFFFFVGGINLLGFLAQFLFYIVVGSPFHLFLI